jgi:hypothetical protein
VARKIWQPWKPTSGEVKKADRHWWRTRAGRTWCPRSWRPRWSCRGRGKSARCCSALRNQLWLIDGRIRIVLFTLRYVHRWSALIDWCSHSYICIYPPFVVTEILGARLEEACLKKGDIFVSWFSTLFCEVKRCFVDPWKNVPLK